MNLATTGTISFSDFLITTDLISQVSATHATSSTVAGRTQIESCWNVFHIDLYERCFWLEKRGYRQDGSKGDGDASDWLLIVKT